MKCVKFQKDMPGLDAAPWPGEIGQRVYENVSAEAWKLWEERQKMILNEYRLMPWQKEGQEIIKTQMEDFFFGEGSALPADYVPQQASSRSGQAVRPCDIAISGSIVNRKRAWASRTARSASSGARAPARR